jgi:D-alanyl-D-alanine carboxypeptidase/D-alanyl-D-alanine-endopeptidase (penicillin-binding protein 4)
MKLNVGKKYRNFTFFRFIIYNLSLIIFLSSCSLQKQIDKTAKQDLINAGDLKSAQIGISIYDPSTNTYLYNFQSDKYFVPASNTKIFTCYADMKYLGDSLIAARVFQQGNKILLLPTGDPTFLHPDFAKQPLLDYLKNFDSTKTITVITNNFQDKVYGAGWSWDDYNEEYMAERCALPVYGNVVKISGRKNNFTVFPSLKGNFSEDSTFPDTAKLGSVSRNMLLNNFALIFNTNKDSVFTVPFCTNKSETNIALLRDILKAKISSSNDAVPSKDNFQIIHSQPTDSLLKIMMHRSDNFYAEQSLLMVSNEKLGVMNDDMIIQFLLENDLKDIPQKPQWVDGSGLSRYNLFTPNDFVFILNKMKSEFTWNLITTIFPSSGNGTLLNHFKNTQGQIFAKTGSLNNNYSLSGYLITKKGKTLIFSVLTGNDMAGGTLTRKAVEDFLTEIIEKY